MTFENVLKGFTAYLAEDTECEVILTKHGYTILVWDKRAHDWDTCEYCETSDALCEALSSAYETFEELKTTKAERDLTAEEREMIKYRCQQIKNHIDALYNSEGNRV